MNINKNLYNYKSTNYKFSKEEQKNLHKSNPVFNMNKQKESYNNMDFIELKHPLDNSSDEIEEQNQITNKNENINVTTSMEKRINNYKSDINEQIEENEDNIGNYRDEENDDMVNFGQSMTNEKINETLKQQKDINVIFEIQSSGEKHNFNIRQDIKFNDLVERAGREGGLFGSFDCGFLKSNLNLLYTALYDASVESRILSACSLCASFFGAVAIYFFLLVMHHYNNELFFDTGKSIFTGFDGFGGGYKKKSHNQDPAYKKRKLRAEIELTSKNDEQSGYNDVKKNEEEEE